MEQLDDVLRPGHEGLVNRRAHDSAAHRHGAGGDALGESDDVGNHAIAFRRKREAEPSEAGDDLIEDQQDAVFIADRPQPLEIALRGRQHAGRARHRLNDDGRDGGGIVQRRDPFEIIGEVRAPLGLALGEGLGVAVVGVRQMVDAGEQRPEELAVVDDAADRDAAEADPVIAALAADQAGTGALAAHVMIGERDLERGVDRLRAGIAEEHMIEIAGRQRRDAACELERIRMAELERRCVVKLLGLALDRAYDLVTAMAGIAAPQAGGGVEHSATVGGVVVHVLGPRNQPRRLLEGAIRREWHPVSFEIVGAGIGRDAGFGQGHWGSWRIFFNSHFVFAVCRIYVQFKPLVDRALCAPPARYHPLHITLNWLAF